MNGTPTHEVGRSYQTATEWDQLASTSRSWTHHLTVRVSPTSYGDAQSGIYIYTAMRCPLPCHVESENPPNSWVWVPTSQNHYGSGILKSEATPADYFDHNANIYTASRNTSDKMYATALTHSPDEIRCENASYVSTSKIGAAPTGSSPATSSCRCPTPRSPSRPASSSMPRRSS